MLKFRPLVLAVFILAAALAFFGVLAIPMPELGLRAGLACSLFVAVGALGLVLSV